MACHGIVNYHGHGNMLPPYTAGYIVTFVCALSCIRPQSLSCIMGLIQDKGLSCIIARAADIIDGRLGF